MYGKYLYCFHYFLGYLLAFNNFSESIFHATVFCCLITKSWESISSLLFKLNFMPFKSEMGSIMPALIYLHIQSVFVLWQKYITENMLSSPFLSVQTGILSTFTLFCNLDHHPFHLPKWKLNAHQTITPHFPLLSALSNHHSTFHRHKSDYSR